ncbi:hypothetical protein [Oceaniovalibus sp. ACAM 378]|uniref:hypothetical protein n=1 Tax=Oceaniovalibus sp. ACAM 378 TaxID=2599923 RepID=UPI0011D9B376|nr:hypothetical protein [Oceaniovalibus sp. ACAM 378]TYB83950.1 hypothetical protein FQ320_23630 [Oceaniovalibus sp. ACAM 378]
MSRMGGLQIGDVIPVTAPAAVLPKRARMEKVGNQRGMMRREMSVKGALEWAFGVEHAQLEFDEVAAVGGLGLPGRGAEARLMEQGALGCNIDTFRGRSHPHDDADLIASVVRNSLLWFQSVRVAELARAGCVPDWMPEARLQCVPVAWRKSNQHGATARTEEVGRITYRTRRGTITKPLLVCPVTYSPTGAQIAAARRSYLEWWGWLLDVRVGLAAVDLGRIHVTDVMPPLRPWQNKG